MTSRAARCFCEKVTGMPVLDSSSLNGPNEGLHASPWHYQKHYRRQVASPTCQDAGVFFSKRASRERHGGHLLVAHVVSLDKSTRCQNSQASCPLSRSKSWPGQQELVIFQEQNRCCFPACACLTCAPFAGLFRGQVACTIPRLRSSQAKEATFLSSLGRRATHPCRLLWDDCHSLGTGQKPPFTAIRRRPLVQSETSCSECSQRRKRCPNISKSWGPRPRNNHPLSHPRLPVLLDIMTRNGQL